MEINAKAINAKRKSLGITQKELSVLMGVSYQTIQNWEGGKNIPKSKEQMLREFLSSEVKDEYEMSDEIPNIVHDGPTGYYHPNVSAAAGMDIKMENDELNRIPINLPNWETGIDFINVYGDSMYPKFCSGEIIGIKEVELQYINYGYAYVVILKNDQVLLKFIKKGSDNDHINLESENKFYEPKEYHLNQIKKVFIIKGVITKTTM